MLDIRREIRKILLENLNNNFKAWFRNSKVSLGGEPRVVYHGTSKKFSQFNLKKAPQPIIWFTTNKDAIASGDVGAAGKGHVMELYVSLQNPAGWKEYEKYGLGQLKGLGYDGAILPSSDGNYDGFVFSPTQIKSPKNRGEWNPREKSIYKESAESSIANIRRLKNSQSVIVYRGLSPSGKNFYQGDKPLPFTYYTLNRDKAASYGTVSEFIFNPNNIPVKVFFGSLFDKFGLDSNIEDAHVIEQLKKEGFGAALQKRDELIVFDATLIVPTKPSSNTSEGLDEENVAFPMQQRVFAESDWSATPEESTFKPKLIEITQRYYHQTSCENAQSILENGFTYPNVGRADYTHGVYFLNFPDANYGPCTIQAIITGNFLDFSNPEDKFGDGWLHFKNSFEANGPEELTKKIRAAYPDLDGIIPMEKMIVVWNADSLSAVKLYSKK